MHPARIRLDELLRRAGEDVILRRMVDGVPVDVTVRARVSGYQPSELSDGLTQQDVRVILSPSEIIEAGWPGASSQTSDKRVPRRDMGDQMLRNGQLLTVQTAAGTYLDDELVRIEMQCRGKP